MVPLNKCEHGHLYRLNSRNLSHGVYRQWDKGFVGIREKFGSRYLFTEYHYDTGPPHGTARPEEDLGLCPIGDLHETKGIPNRQLFDWIASQSGKQLLKENLAAQLPIVKESINAFAKDSSVDLELKAEQLVELQTYISTLLRELHGI